MTAKNQEFFLNIENFLSIFPKIQNSLDVRIRISIVLKPAQQVLKLAQFLILLRWKLVENCSNKKNQKTSFQKVVFRIYCNSAARGWRNWQTRKIQALMGAKPVWVRLPSLAPRIRRSSFEGRLFSFFSTLSPQSSQQQPQSIVTWILFLPMVNWPYTIS